MIGAIREESESESEYDKASDEDSSIASQQLLHSDEVDEDEPNEKLES